MRKKPTQQRSQQAVEALIQATGQVIAEHGLDGLTTIKVAARAGISIGSLYQYFENKEALLAALQDRLTRELSDLVNRTAPPLLNADIETIVRSLLLAAFDFFESEQGLYLELLRNWYRLDIARGLHHFEQNMLEVTRAYLIAHARDLRLGNVPAQTFVVINSVVFTLLRYLSLPQRPLFDRAQLIEELTVLIARYVSGGARAGGA
ncbi:MAG: TetR/AcrR family transcriptional regulator [Nevskia sp.]|nr:TetR/AcrR family transcriptional regulator [Nevskia sp.]